MPDYQVRWFEPDSPPPAGVDFECATFATGWEFEPCAVYGETYYPSCYDGRVTSDEGWIKARTLFGDSPHTFGGESNIMALPEADGLAVGLAFMLLLSAIRRRG